ncbi:MFS transporter [Streptococcus hongkongensis]|nr:MFS transporter [Streptococcus uberis]
MKNKFLPTIGSLYVNYIFQGIATIIISQNMSLFQDRWHSSISQITLVISAVGFGRILSINLAGLLSDALGRRKAVILGALSYVIFYLGLVFSPSYLLAFVFAIFAGIGNSFLDTATYPTVVEASESHQNNGALSVLNKSFISMGQFLLPIITSFLIKQHLFFGWTFLVSAGLLLVNCLFLARLPFPAMSSGEKANSLPASNSKEHVTVSANGAKFAIEGICLLVFSLVSVSLFNIFIIWVPTFADQIVGVSKTNSLMFVSLYSICSFTSVFLTSAIIKKGVNVVHFIITCTTLTALALITMLVLPNMITLILATVAIGFFAAGGIWQLGLVVLLEFFPNHRGRITSYYSLATSLSVMAIPYLTGILAEKNIELVFVLLAALAILGSLVQIIVSYRYNKVFHSSAAINNL